jgi:hypothetical protein
MKLRKTKKYLSLKADEAIEANQAIEAHRGFTLLYSVLIASILLSIGLAIFNITLKEFTLSSLGRESQFAFYAADTGIECALYWDTKNNAFDPAVPAPPPIDCNNAPRTIDTAGSGGSIFIRRFEIDFGTDGPHCAKIVVTKDTSSGFTKTTVESRGYNTCVLTNPRRVERAIRATY